MQTDKSGGHQSPRAIAENNTAHSEAPAPLTLTAEGAPFTGWEETGEVAAWRREVTRQTYRVEGVELIKEHHRHTYRVDSLRVNVDDASDVEVVLIRQRTRGGDFVNRLGLRERATMLPELAARIAVTLAPAPAADQAPPAAVAAAEQAHVKRAAEAESWLYAEGAARYFAQAFGEYVGTSQVEYESLPAAKRAFDYDPRGRDLLRKHGSTPL